MVHLHSFIYFLVATTTYKNKQKCFRFGFLIWILHFLLPLLNLQLVHYCWPDSSSTTQTHFRAAASGICGFAGPQTVAPPLKYICMMTRAEIWPRLTERQICLRLGATGWKNLARRNQIRRPDLLVGVVVEVGCWGQGSSRRCWLCVVGMFCISNYLADNLYGLA